MAANTTFIRHPTKKRHHNIFLVGIPSQTFSNMTQADSAGFYFHSRFQAHTPQTLMLEMLKETPELVNKESHTNLGC